MERRNDMRSLVGRYSMHISTALPPWSPLWLGKPSHQTQPPSSVHSGSVLKEKRF